MSTYIIEVQRTIMQQYEVDAPSEDEAWDIGEGMDLGAYGLPDTAEELEPEITDVYLKDEPDWPR